MTSLSKNLKTIFLPAAVIAVVVAGLSFGAFRLGMLDAVELKTLDMRFALRGERPMAKKDLRDVVKVVAVDAGTIAEVGRWPWPRGVIAKLVSGVCGGGAADTGEDWEDAEGWEDIEDGGEAAAREAPEEKSAVSKPLRRNVLGLDVILDRRERPYAKNLLRGGAMMDPAEQDAMLAEALGSCEAVAHVSLMKFPKSGSAGVNLGKGDNAKSFRTPDGEVVLNEPLPEFLTDTSAAGFANMLTSVHDERVRKARLYHRLGGRTVYSFAALALAAWLGVDEKDIRAGKNTVEIGEYKIPVSDNGEIYINYRGKEYKPEKSGDVFKENVFSARDVMETPELTAMLGEGGHIFLVGVTDPESRDVFFTPFAAAKRVYRGNAVLAGIEVHKEIIDTILQGEYLRDAPAGRVFLLALAAAFIAATAAVYRLWAGVAAAVLAAAAHALFAFNAFAARGEVQPVFTVFAALPVALAAGITWRNLVVDREKRAVRNIFKRYVAPHVLTELMENPDDLKLGGKKSRVSVLFSDIRGFTSISEAMPPEILIKGLNLYLSEMTKIVHERSGMVDKFIGDAVMAVWGAPAPHANDTLNAVAAAVRMRGTLERINPEIRELCGHEFAIGVGVNTGEATLGNIGSENKLDYTVIGDTVNLASRLEGLTKQYGAFLIVSEFTWEDVRGSFDGRLLDFVKVKGKDKPVGIHEVFDEKGRLDETRRRMLDAYNEAMEHYHARRWDAAAEAFARAAAALEDKTSRMYIDRCAHFTKSPPPPDWDGSFEWKTK